MVKIICSKCIEKGLKKPATHVVEMPPFLYVGIPSRSWKYLCNKCYDAWYEERDKD